MPYDGRLLAGVTILMAVVEAGTSGSWEDAAPQAPERPAPEVRKVAVNERPAPKHAPAPRGGVATSQGWEEEF